MPRSPAGAGLADGRLAPGPFVWYVCRGSVYLEAEEYEEALRNYELAIDRDVEDTSGYFGRGRVYLDQGDCQAAGDEFQKVIELQPYSSGATVYVGYTQLCELEYTAAIETFQTAAEMNPYDSSAVFGLGRAYMGEERYEDVGAPHSDKPRQKNADRRRGRNHGRLTSR